MGRSLVYVGDDAQQVRTLEQLIHYYRESDQIQNWGREPQDLRDRPAILGRDRPLTALYFVIT